MKGFEASIPGGPGAEPGNFLGFSLFAREYDRYSNFLTIYYNCTPEYFSPLACINCGFKLELILHDAWELKFKYNTL